MKKEGKKGLRRKGNNQKKKKKEKKTNLSFAARHGNIHKSSSICNPLLRPAFWRLLLFLRLNLMIHKKASQKKKLVWFFLYIYVTRRFWGGGGGEGVIRNVFSLEFAERGRKREVEREIDREMGGGGRGRLNTFVLLGGCFGSLSNLWGLRLDLSRTSERTVDFAHNLLFFLFVVRWKILGWWRVCM